MERARRNLREKEDLLLLDLGFEPAGKDLWRRDGIHFGREAALQRVQRELLESGGGPIGDTLYEQTLGDDESEAS
jgi:hypothetical protein